MIDMDIFRGLMTLIIMLLFVAICVSVYSGKKNRIYQRAARMALEEENTGDKHNE